MDTADERRRVRPESGPVWTRFRVTSAGRRR
jgi:hypothetical protein